MLIFLAQVQHFIMGVFGDCYAALALLQQLRFSALEVSTEYKIQLQLMEM